VRYRARASAIRGGRWLAADSVLGAGVSGLCLAALLLLLRLLFLVLIGTVSAGRAIAAQCASVAARENHEAE
jgi:hypothetical protein